MCVRVQCVICVCVATERTWGLVRATHKSRIEFRVKYMRKSCVYILAQKIYHFQCFQTADAKRVLKGAGVVVGSLGGVILRCSAVLIVRFVHILKYVALLCGVFL